MSSDCRVGMGEVHDEKFMEFFVFCLAELYAHQLAETCIVLGLKHVMPQSGLDSVFGSGEEAWYVGWRLGHEPTKERSKIVVGAKELQHKAHGELTRVAHGCGGMSLASCGAM